MLAAVQRGRTREVAALDDERRTSAPDPSDAPLIALCEALARARSREAGLAYELVAARADLQAIVDAWRHDRPEPPVRTLTGWRRELVGAELLELLNGRIELSVDETRRLHIAR